MSKQIGITKELDNLGRVLIPKEIRTMFNFGKEVELVITNGGVLLRNPQYKLIKNTVEKVE